jgi:nitrate reductase gamma subunit
MSGGVCGSVQTGDTQDGSMFARAPKEIHMYIGGGILGTILIIALIVFLLRRA